MNILPALRIMPYVYTHVIAKALYPVKCVFTMSRTVHTQNENTLLFTSELIMC